MPQDLHRVGQAHSISKVRGQGEFLPDEHIIYSCSTVDVENERLYLSPYLMTFFK